MDTTAQGILSTLIYHDQFDYPLTRDECWRWWYGGRDEAPTRERVEAACRQLIADGRVLATGGFLHLPKREPIVALRIERAGHNHIKWHNARRAARWLQTVPFFRYLAVCNTVAINNGKPESDVDVFIVARRGRLWLTRALVTAVVQSLGLRRHGTKIANRVCLSFFVTDAALDFSPLLLKPADPYFAFWVAQLVPLYDPDNLSGTIRANNAWVTGSLPNAFSTRPSTPYSLLPPHSRLLHAKQRFLEKMFSGRFGNWCEALARNAQKRKMESVARTSPLRRVVITDDVLKFHEEDRRQQYNLRFLEQRERLLGQR